MNQEQVGFSSNHDTAFVAGNLSQQVYTGAGTNEKQADSSSFEHNNTTAGFAADPISYQSFITSTDFNLSDTGIQEPQQQQQQQDPFSFDAFQQPHQIHQHTYQQPQQPEQQQQYQHYEPQKAVESTQQQADYYSHYDQYNNPVNNPQPQQQQTLPQQLIQHILPDTNQYSSVDNLPHHPTNIPSDTTTPLHSQSLMHLPAPEKSHCEVGSGMKGRTVWQEAASEVPAMHAIFLLLFIFTTAVFLIVTEDCLPCFYILPCVSLISLACFYKLAC